MLILSNDSVIPLQIHQNGKKKGKGREGKGKGEGKGNPDDSKCCWGQDRSSELFSTIGCDINWYNLFRIFLASSTQAEYIHTWEAQIPSLGTHWGHSVGRRRVRLHTHTRTHLPRDCEEIFYFHNETFWARRL